MNEISQSQLQKVACWGCFDGPLHKGHKFFLNEALIYGDLLYVFLCPEKIIRRKRPEPLCSTTERQANVQAISPRILAIALIGETVNDEYQEILSAQPDTFCFGEDQVKPTDLALEEKLLAQGAQIITIPKIEPDAFSTSKLYPHKS
jgi:cytidyltransferase-like protein